MGMFDELVVVCPKCHEGHLEWQSKAGGCTLAAYTLENMPPEVAGDLADETSECDNCDFVGTLRIQMFARVE